MTDEKLVDPEKLEWKYRGPLYAELGDFTLVITQTAESEIHYNRGVPFSWCVTYSGGTARLVAAAHGYAKTIEEAREIGEKVLRWVVQMNSEQS